MNESTKVGTSLAFCVRDIVLGKSSIEDVEAIVAGTHFKSPEDAIEAYQNTYWANFKDEAATVCRLLWKNGKIIQPGLADMQAVIYVRNLWYSSREDFIKSQLVAGRLRVASMLC